MAAASGESSGATWSLDGFTIRNVAVDGLLTGNGTVGTLAINSGGHVAPGTSPGTINAIGPLMSVPTAIAPYRVMTWLILAVLESFSAML